MEHVRNGPRALMANEDCLFCRIGRHEVPADIVLEDDLVVAFRDINPKAPTHVLLISRAHIDSAAELASTDAEMLARLFGMAALIAREAGVENGYRMATNVGPGAGQSVKHLHFHLLGGRPFSWPPG